MTFGEHLEELRRRVIFGLIAFAVAFAAAFAFQDQLMGLFARPFERARAAINADLVLQWAAKPHAPSTASRLVDRLLDLFVETEKGRLDEAKVKELRELQAKERLPDPPQLGPLQAISPGETIAAYMLVCLLSAAVISAPVLLLQLWQFVAAGLYANERHIVMRVLPFSLLLFFLGLAFGYFVLAELSVRFLVGYGDLEYIRPQVAIGAYLGLLFMLLLVMGLVFQIPLIMTVLAAVGLAKPQFFRSKRRHFILAIFIVAAIITPPDYISQLLVAAPMLLLFEIGIWMASGAAKRRASSPPGPSAPRANGPASGPASAP